MPIMLNVLVGLAGLAILLVVFGWLGLRVRPRSFPVYEERTPELETVPLPEGLPAPVARYYKSTIGDQVPVIDSAVLTGRANLRFMGITFPGRYRIIHDAGQGYRHYIEATFFDLLNFPLNHGQRTFCKNALGQTIDLHNKTKAEICLLAQFFFIHKTLPLP